MALKKENGKWRLDIRPEGLRGKRIVKIFDSKAQALQYQNRVLSGRFDIQGDQPFVDNRRLNDLIQIWFDLHGRSLKSSVDTKNRLFKLSGLLGNPYASSVDSETLAKYRKARLDSGISPSTLNRELITLKALFRELKRLGVINYDSPILLVRKLREKKIELSYLTDTQVKILMQQVELSKNESLPFVVTICLVTGARWSEAEGLTVANCINQGFQFVDTKNGGSRFVSVEKSVFIRVKSRLIQGPFRSCYSAYRSAFKRTGFKVPDGQLAHILRHTFASHFVMKGGNILALQRILGHSSLNITMRYAHLAPDFFVDAVKLNPLAIANNPIPG
ncbi:MAG: tyrosine-type recombinase/integrase [Methylobacter sp.]|uniref:phage integrase n=1 Tax=Methylobacter sp. TaxID=2051955 RepID=UPI0025845088|nr:tyrosine-type recombinase/integrase [Methylobacter sp.]MCL7422880.1 tyrosine-type recombinase/integrase [Methylobacter sp.]